jgi:hypothetical protein
MSQERGSIGYNAGMIHCLLCGATIHAGKTHCPACHAPVEELRFPIEHAFIVWFVTVVCLWIFILLVR